MKKHKVVVIGGGTGLSLMLRGIKQIDQIDLSAIVTVADDGGSTGRLRRQFHIPAMGDIRNVMCALAEDESEFIGLMNFRFSGDEQDVGGHNLGNLILTAMTQKHGSFMEAIKTISKVLNVKGHIIPSSLEVLTLFAIMEDGTIVRGESNIPKHTNRIKKIYYDVQTHATKEAIEAIKQADLILYGIGSLYTSIVPNLVINGISDALMESNAKKVYFCNAMSQPGESDGFSLEDHVQGIIDHSYQKAVDIVVTHTNYIEEKLKIKYGLMGSEEVKVTQDVHPYELLYRDILRFDDDLIRHDSEKIKKCVEEIIKRELG